MDLFNRRKRSVDDREQFVMAEDQNQDIHDAFTNLAAAAVANPAGPATGAFWKAVYDLEVWHFLPNSPPGERIEERMGSGQPVGPLVVQLEGKRYVAAFTSKERVLACVKRNGLGKIGDGFALLSMPRDAAVSYLCGLADDVVEGVLFNHNHGEHGMTTPLDNIAAMYEFYLNQLYPPLFDRFVRAVVRANSPDVWARLNRHFTEMERWLFIGDVDRPQSPQLFAHDGAIMAMLFTDEEHAVRGAGVVGGADAQGRVPLIPMTPQAAASHLGQLQSHSAEQGHSVKDVIVNLGSVPFIMSIDDLRRFVEIHQ